MGRGLTLFGELHWLLGFSRATEKPARTGSSLKPEGRARASLEKGEAGGLFTSLVEVLNVHILWGEGDSCEMRQAFWLGCQLLVPWRLGQRTQ